MRLCRRSTDGKPCCSSKTRTPFVRSRARCCAGTATWSSRRVMVSTRCESQSVASGLRRRVPIGAEYLGDRQTHLRVWAPNAETLHAIVDGGEAHALTPESAGYYSGWIAAVLGDLYQFKVNGDERLYPDPA